MSPAAVLEFRQPASSESAEKSTERFRMVMHDELDKMIDRLAVVFEEGRRPSLMELSDLITEVRQDFLGSCLEHLIEGKYVLEAEQESSPCPRCGKVSTQKRKVRKKLETMQGPCELKRMWFYCSECGEGFTPLDTVAEICRREKQLDVQKRCVKLSAQVTFACASEIFEDLTGQKVSDHFIHEVFEDVGAQACLEEVVPDSEEIGKRIEEATSGKWRPILVVASDGAHLPTRSKARRDAKRGPGQYKEAKGFRIYLVGKGRIIHVASWHQIQNEEQFGIDLALAAQRIPQKKVRIALLGDGADWLWKHMKACFPTGCEVLDYYHCCEHVHEVAKTQYGERSPEALEWVEATLCRLFFGEVGHCIAGLRRMKPKTPQAGEIIRKFIGYLKKHRDRLNYRSRRLGGYPIGSGGIESANKFICHTRMKRSGAWWVKDTGNAMLRIRCSIYNGTYDRVFERYRRAAMAPKKKPPSP
jgi:hypothetical protein